MKLRIPTLTFSTAAVLLVLSVSPGFGQTAPAASGGGGDTVIKLRPVDPAAIDDVMFGCVDALGPQAGDIARTAWLAGGFPEEVPGVTIDRQCGSAQQAISFAAQSIMAGVNDLVMAGGVQNMSMIPIGYALTATGSGTDRRKLP